jgi:glycosyltransferase involved in cell wall biosynthesis
MIIAISESTKKDIIHFYGIDPDKIKVIYQSCNPLFYTNQERAKMPGALKKYNLPSEFLLFVGSLEKRKNPELIVEAFEYLSPENKIPLVFVGRGKDYKKKLNQLVKSRGLEKYVIWISDLEDNNHLQVIYQNATALIYPSLYEGFGLPVVEALLSKIPVITSKFSSLPEAGGPGSVYVNPTKAEELANAIGRVLGDSDLRNSMITNGYDYARKMFSPVHVSEQMIASYNRLVNK